MRKANYAIPVWPYVGAVVCLFVLTLLAPFTWRNVATSRPANWKSPSRGVASPGADQRRVIASALPPELAAPPQFPERVEVVPSPAVTSTGLSQRPLAATELSGFAAPMRLAVTAPPVGDRIRAVVRSPELAQASTPDHRPAVLTARRVSPAPARRLEVPILQPQRTIVAPTTLHHWPLALTLIESFRALQDQEETRAWATGAIATLEAFHRQNALAAPELAPLLKKLQAVAQEGVVLATQASTPDLRSQIVRTGYAAVRRELVWRQVYLITSKHGAATAPRVSNQKAQDHLRAVRLKIGDSANAQAWQTYLRLDELQQQMEHADVDQRAALARNVLLRLNSPKLTAQQRAVLQQPPFTVLERELRRWVVEPIAYPRLLNDIELYEQTRAAEAAHRIAASYQVIRWSDNKDIAKLATILDAHYRNANLRVAVRDVLLNRLLPEQDDFEEEVNENIIGAQVLGNAQGSARMRTVLIPDQRRWRFGLEVEGEVESQTAATRGPATFFNDGYSRYQARKLFQVDRRGVLVSDSEAVANTNSELTGFRTLFDSLPVIGWLARGIARQQHDDQTEMARWVSETRLETKMRERLDREVQTRLEDAQTKVENKIIAPLEKLKLNPDAMEMRTTKDRLIARYRLAGKNHLGSFTPRPQAPSDSMLSVQVHETMLNNTLENLGLDGRRTKLRQLYRDLADAFDRSDLAVPDDIPENVTIQFADVIPVRVRCEDGKLTLTLQIAELKNRRNSWHNFEVRAEYVPDSTNLHAHLVRDGIIQLIGDRLSFGDQIALRTIFSRALSKNQPFNVINRKLAENPAMADLNVNQFVITDGWIGVALGPHRVAANPAPTQPVVR